MSITVAQALKMGGLRQGRVLAGAHSLDRIVEKVNIIEAFSESDWETGWDFENQLVLTTFHLTQGEAGKQVGIVELCARGGCAALVFQQGIIPHIAPEAVRRADELGLPLIQVPEAVIYPQIIAPVTGAILREKTFLLERSHEVHARLTELILGGGGLDAVASALQELIERPVAITDYWGRPLAMAGLDHVPPLAAWIAALTAKAPAEWKANLHWNEAHNLCLAPIVAGPSDAVGGFILVHAPNGRLDRFDRNAVEQAATIAALDLAKQRAVLEAERRLKRDFIEDLLGEGYRSEEAISARARSLGWELRHKRVVAIVDLCRFEQYYLTHLERGESHFQQIKNRFLCAVSQVVSEHSPESIAVDQSDSVILLPHLDRELPPSMARLQIQALAEAICDQAQAQLDELGVSIAIGGFRDSLRGLVDSYREAKRALSIVTKMGLGLSIIWYEDLAHYDLLDRIADQPGCRRWLDKTLGPLLAYDADNNTELVETLETYFDCNQTSQQTAYRLSIHPKTLQYRLRRIAEILGADPISGDRQLGFYLATKLARLLPPAD